MALDRVTSTEIGHMKARQSTLKSQLPWESHVYFLEATGHILPELVEVLQLFIVQVTKAFHVPLQDRCVAVNNVSHLL